MGLEDATQVLTQPFLEFWPAIKATSLGILYVILWLILGYLVGALIGHIVKKLLKKTNVIDTVVKKIGLQDEIGKWDLPGFFGLITKWYLFLIFGLTPAAESVSLPNLSAFLTSVALWIPKIISAIVIVMVGYVLAEYIAKKIKEVKSTKSSLTAKVAKVITLIFVVLIALKQIGIEVSVAENSFLIILAGVMLGLAIAFGLGFKDEAKAIVKSIRKKL